MEECADADVRRAIPTAQSLFAHFLMFGLTFELLDPKECRAPREGWGFVVGDLMDVSASRFAESRGSVRVT